MRAAVAEGVGAMRVLERPEPDAPGAGQVVVRPEAVGICGSDYSLFSGHMSEAAGGSQFPRVLGHEVGATVVAVGPDCPAGVAVGQRVAMLPISSCGRCYPCRAGRPNACDQFQLIGIHLDGGMQDLLTLPAAQVFPAAVDDAAVAALAEPMSVAVHAVARARLVAGERAVVLGAGPIGQCLTLVATERGADVLAVDLQDRRLDMARLNGAVETLRWTDGRAVVAAAREWAGDGGPPVVFDATGVAEAVRAMVDMVASAGRAVQVGMSPDEVSLRIGSLTEKELDLLGASCCDAGDFAEAVAVVERQAEAVARLVSHEFRLTEAPEALDFAMSNPTDVMKVVIRGE